MSAARNNALDGIRGCAVTAVLMYHAHYGWARGGFLGVDMFFVLSGYLITTGLLSLHLAAEHGLAVVYLRFLARRAARLAPALLVALGSAFALTAVTGTTADRTRLARCTLAAGGYVMNVPAAEQLHCSAIWHVTWSLAAEEQFYLLWPLFLAGLVVIARITGLTTRPAVATAALTLYLSSVIWQIYVRTSDPSTARVLFAPDGRSLVLLVGCALAAARIERLTARLRLVVGLAGAFVLAVDLAYASAGSGYGTLAALLAAAAGTVGLIAGVTGPKQCAALSRALGSRVPAALGRLSYSLYLFHELAFRVADLVADRGTVAYELVRWPLCLTAAVCSYRLVEQPCRKRLNGLLDRRHRTQPGRRRLGTEPQPTRGTTVVLGPVARTAIAPSGTRAASRPAEIQGPLASR